MHKLAPLLSAGLLLNTAAVFALAPAPSHSHPQQASVQQVHVNISAPPVYGRSATEYFITPIIGVNYVDITQISTNFFESDTREIKDNVVNVNKTELAGLVGLLFDVQYQITATDYWRGGFQTGLIYTSPADTHFEVEVADIDSSDQVAEDATLETSSVQLPVLFTLSRYAASDEFILTFALGPLLVYQMYDTDLEGFHLEPESEMQILFHAGIDGRFRIGDSNNFALVGFDAVPSFGGSGNGFSGVETLGGFMVYAGWSFS